MTTIQLSPGDHVIEWSLDGHEPITATINLGVDGVLTCVSVITKTCAEAVKITGSTITGLLKSITESQVCNWTLSKNGWNNLVTFDIMDLIQGYIGQKDLGFTVTTAHIMGIIAYYNDQPESGNALTGCDFS